MNAVLRAAGLLIPLLVVASIWVPPLHHHFVPAPPPADDILQRLRSVPGDGLLTELGAAKHALVPPLGRVIEDPAVEADALLGPGDGSTGAAQAPYPLNPNLLNDLDYASLIVPRTLLKAYASTGNERYFAAARRFLADWADLELGAWLPRGLLWNDHAIAVRSITYSEFWRLFRRHPDFNPAEARQFLRLVVAAAARLADPVLYTHTSNHGTMQNLALMHLGLAFPELDGFAALPDLGLRRQQEQYGYMMSSEGVVLEHSAGYHRLGMELLGIMLRYRTLQQGAIPQPLATAYARARSVYRQLSAADGTLPPLGDTSIALLGPQALTTELTDAGDAAPLSRDPPQTDPAPASWYPDAGYAIWWSSADAASRAAQTSITWAHFPRHGHKHADELSFNLRTGPTFWWRSSGYWPLGHGQRGAAKSWTGSNAPHLAGEPYHSERRSELLGHAAAQGLRIIDLRRSGPGDFRVRRQLIHVEPDLWLSIDAFGGAPGQSARILWTTDHDIAITTGTDPTRFSLIPQASSARLKVHFLGAPDVAPRLLRGQTRPFAGWVEIGFRPKPADALLVELPARDSWVANVSLLTDAGAPPVDGPVAKRWRGPESWHFEVPTGTQTLSIRRQGDRLRLALLDSPEAGIEIPLEAPEADSVWRRQSKQDHARAAARYGPPFKDVLPYRTRMSLWLGILLGLQLAGLWALGRYASRVQAPAGMVASLVWIGIGGWLHLSYFAA